MDLLKTILEPLRFVLERMLEAINALAGNYGVAIILLAIAVSLLLSPVAALARKAEAKDKERQLAMAPAIAAAKATLSGRERFEKIDAIYAAHSYHPIQSMAAVLPLFIQLPFLLAALYLLVDYAPLAGQGFLVIRDLSAPDALLRAGALTLNLVPLAMTAVTLAESQIRPEATPASRAQFRIVAALLLILVYRFPAAVCLYWLAANSVSLVRSALRARAVSAASARS